MFSSRSERHLHECEASRVRADCWAREAGQSERGFELGRYRRNVHMDIYCQFPRNDKIMWSSGRVPVECQTRDVLGSNPGRD